MPPPTESPAALPAATESVAAVAHTRRVGRGALIVVAGAPAETVYFVRSGQVRVYVLADNGQEATTAVLGPGQLFGISALVGEAAYHEFAEALTLVEVWTAPRQRLLQHMAGDTALLGAVLAALGQRLALTDALVRDAVLLPVAQRIPDVLERLGACLGGEAPSLNREHLATLVGARRETVSRAACRGRDAAA